MEPVWSKKQKPLRKTKNESFAHLLVGYDTDPYVFLFKDGRKLPSRVRTRLEPMCFNEATHSRAWKPLLVRDGAGRFCCAPMEPRTHARGNDRCRPA